MSEWKPLTLGNQELVNEARIKSRNLLSDYSFTNLFMWNDLRHYEWAEISGQLCIKFIEEQSTIYLFPLGNSPLNALDILLSENRPFYMRAIPEDALTVLQKPFKLKEEETRADYIYSFQDLLHLSGNKFQAKRNLIHQFEKNNDFHYKRITREMVPSLLHMLETWYQRNQKLEHSVEREFKAVKTGLDHYFSLPLEGGALIIGDKIVGFSFAERIDSSMWLIHAEKADIQYKGVYQILNHLLIESLEPTEFVNREENLGITGLSRSKESYHPVKVLKKFSLKKTIAD